jgi:hypothetical protein
MADGSLITTTQQAGLRPLGIHGQPVAEAHGQIIRYLARALSPQHAALFAEPNFSARPGTVEWYATVDGAAVRADSLAPEARPAFDAELARLVGDVTRQCAVLKNAKETSDQLLGQLLELALRIPGNDHIYAVGAQPVLVGWGHLVDSPAADEAVLQRRIQGPPVPPPMPAPPPPPPPEPRRVWPWALAALALVMLLFTLFLPYLARPLVAMLLRPDAGFCAIPEGQTRLYMALQNEYESEAALRRDLVQIEAQIAERAAQCVAQPSQPGQPRRPPQTALAPPTPQTPMRDPPRTTPIAPRIPDLPPGGVTLPDGGVRLPDGSVRLPDGTVRLPDGTTRLPDGTVRRPDQAARPPDVRPPDPRTPDPRAQDPQRRPGQDPQTNPPRLQDRDPRQAATRPSTDDLRQRQQRDNAGQGEANVTLAWNTQDDLDLVVQCPNGEQINYRSPQACGGTLEIDMNAGSNVSPTPLESVNFPSVAGAPPGRYRIVVQNQSNDRVPYRVRVNIRGQPRDFEGEVGPRENAHVVGEFSLPN